MVATSEVPVKFGESNGGSRGRGHEPPLIAQETVRSISYLRNFSAETKATLLPPQIAEHLFHSGFQFNSIQCVCIHVIDNFLSVPSSNIRCILFSCPVAWWRGGGGGGGSRSPLQFLCKFLLEVISTSNFTRFCELG